MLDICQIPILFHVISSCKFAFPLFWCLNPNCPFFNLWTWTYLQNFCLISIVCTQLSVSLTKIVMQLAQYATSNGLGEAWEALHFECPSESGIVNLWHVNFFLFLGAYKDLDKLLARSFWPISTEAWEAKLALKLEFGWVHLTGAKLVVLCVRFSIMEWYHSFV
jgi:hypothetical protein